MKSVIKDASNQTLEMSDGQWILSGGFKIGSTWDIILNSDFAKVVWGEEAKEHLTNLVLMANSERINYLRQFIESPEEEQESEEDYVYVQEEPVDALMSTIQIANAHLKKNSIGLYEDSCDRCYKWTSKVMKKTTVTALTEEDYILLNAANKATAGAISEYLRQNGKSSFGRCPDYGKEELNHDQTCSIEKRTMDWLTRQNDGC